MSIKDTRRYKKRKTKGVAGYGKTDPVMKKKLAGLFIIVVLALVAIAVKITYINASSGKQYSKAVLSQSQSQYSSTTIPYKRGDILDSNGTVLATSQKMYNVILDCYVANSDENYFEPTVNALVTMFNADENTVRKLLTDDETKESRYKIIVKDVSVEDKQTFESYLEETEGLSEEEIKNRNNIKGIWFEEEYVRTYPFGALACDVIGFTNSGNSADWGIEGYYNNVLNGVNGRKFGYFTSNSNLEQTIVDAVDGNSVVSTLDLNIQQICEKYITDYMNQMTDGPFGTKGAANVGVIVMDPNDGSILAMASNDTYDLNDPRNLSGYYEDAQIAVMSEEQKLDALNEIWRNFCISDTFEPGSVFKPITMSAALEDATLSGSETYYCDGYEEVAGTRIKCSDVQGHGQETLSDVIMNSCNDGMMQIVEKMGSDEFCKYQQLFGFGSKTGIDLSGEASGVLYSSSALGDVELATSSFGQGFNCTMIQEAAAFASVINGGYYYKPHIVNKIIGSDGTTVKTYDAELEKQTISNSVSSTLRSYLKASVDSGTSIYSKVDGYTSGGKTGTAQKLPRGNGKYLVSFIGFWPVDDPQVVCYVVVDEPNIADQANSAYPQVIAREIMTEVLPYLNIFPDETLTGNTPLDIAGAKAIGVTQSADTNVPVAAEDTEVIEGGNTRESDGYTNEDAGIE